MELLYRKIEKPLSLAFQWQCHCYLADLHHREYDCCSALTSFQEALAISRKLRDKSKEANTLKDLASVSNCEAPQ